MKLSFYGADRQVTGSCYLLEAGGLRIMIDCGLFQERQFQDRNWSAFPFDPGSVDVMLLTHAHLDHCGLVPKLVRDGFKGDILTTPVSARLAEIVMKDAARIQEEDAAYKAKRHRKHKRKGKHPEVPLYTVDDANRATSHLKGLEDVKHVKLNDRVTAEYHHSGHILGSSSIELTVREGSGEKTIVFSGDLGQWNKPLIPDPQLIEGADYVVVESTYGDRLHKDEGLIDDRLAEIINDAHKRKGNVIIPTFAIERAQELLFYLSRLTRAKRIPMVPVFLDSPMAVSVTEVFSQYSDYLDKQTQQMMSTDHNPLEFPGLHLSRTTSQSKAINAIRGTAIILAGSGMCTGGRIKHHLAHHITRKTSTVLFVGYQAVGTLGRQILERPAKVRIHGMQLPVKARIEQLHGLSAHGDRDDLLRWLGGFEKRKPGQVFVTHGEAETAEHFAQTIREKLGYASTVPEYQQTVDLS